MTAHDSIPFLIPEQHTPYVLYRFYDAEGVLLYVGITNELRRRCTEHSYKGWFGEVARVEVTGFRSQDRAAAMEALVIAEHSPKYNRAGGGNSVASSPGRKAVPARSVTLRIPLPIYEWLRAEAELQGLELTEVALRALARTWEVDGLTPELSRYNVADGPMQKVSHRT